MSRGSAAAEQAGNLAGGVEVVVGAVVAFLAVRGAHRAPGLDEVPETSAELALAG